MRKKGQILTTDAIIAMGIFIVILIASIEAWDFSREKILLNEVRDDLEIIAKQTASVLVETPGNPSNWTDLAEANFNATIIQSLGMARSSSMGNHDTSAGGNSIGLNHANYGIIDSAKAARLENVSPTKYEEMKKMLGVRGPGYEFHVLVKPWNGSDYITQYTFGRTPNATAANVIRADRFTLMGNVKTNVVVNIWEQCYGVICQ
jgi:hypothetical protein